MMVSKLNVLLFRQNHDFCFLDDIFLSTILNFVELVTITNEECGEAYGQESVI